MKNSLLSDFDIFAKRLGLFYNSKERIGSFLGLILTFIYIVTSLLLFFYFTFITIQRRNFQVNDLVIYPQDIPQIDLNNSDLFYLAFGVKNKKNSTRFVDETIFTAKVLYFYDTKNEEGNFITQEKRELKIEKCKVEKFGKNYQNFFAEGEFNNSYCVNKFDLALVGGFIYTNFSYIRILIKPCVNKTENNYHCQPQNIIDNALTGGYFSILLKDIGLNPSNYSFPILPTIQNFYTTISKSFFRDVIFFYEITKVESDTSLFFEKKNSLRYLKLDKIKESFYSTEEENYDNGKIICKIDIRLSDYIHVQKRSYSKISNVFSITGGYMQIIYTIFSLLVFIPNKFRTKKIVVNHLLNLDMKYERKKTGLTVKRNSTIFNDNSKKNFIVNLKSINKSNDIQTNENIMIPVNKKRNSVNMINMFTFGKKATNNSKLPFFFADHSGNISFMEHSNNASRVEMNQKQSDYKYMGSQNFGNQSFNRSLNRSISRSLYNNNNLIRNYSVDFLENIISKGIKKINMNIFEYFCFAKLFKYKKKYIEIFNKSYFLYKERMDFINLFRDLLIYEKCLKENYHFEKSGAYEEENIYSSKLIN